MRHSCLFFFYICVHIIQVYNSTPRIHCMWAHISDIMSGSLPFLCSMYVGMLAFPARCHYHCFDAAPRLPSSRRCQFKKQPNRRLTKLRKLVVPIIRKIRTICGIHISIKIPIKPETAHVFHSKDGIHNGIFAAILLDFYRNCHKR